MGFRLHTRTKSIIEYSDSCYFNWAYDELREVFHEYCPTFYHNDDSSEWEVSREDFEKLIDLLKEKADKDPSGIFIHSEWMDYTNEEVLATFEKIYEATSNEEDFSNPDIINFDWF